MRFTLKEETAQLNREAAAIASIHETMLAELAHEEILAGLAGERAHSRIRTAQGREIRWTYNSDGSMTK
jgi:hypothetical protein